MSFDEWGDWEDGKLDRVRLQYFDRALVCANFDPATLTIVFEGTEKPSWIGEVSGVCTILAGSLVVLAKHAGTLRLFVGNRSASLDEVALELRGSFEERELIVVWPGSARDRLCYSPIGWIENDPTPFVERSHFDFGMYLGEVAADPDRQSRLLEQWT